MVHMQMLLQPGDQGHPGLFVGLTVLHSPLFIHHYEDYISIYPNQNMIPQNNGDNHDDHDQSFHKCYQMPSSVHARHYSGC